MIYLDNAATTRVADAVADEIDKTLRQYFGNPSSLYDLGLQASRVLEASRQTLAAALGCSAAEVVFCGTGTEANNIAVLGAARARRAWGREVVMTGYEHAGVYNAVQSLQREGFAVHIVDPSPDGAIDPDALLGHVGKTTALVACMAVNNETGARIDVPALAAQIKRRNKRTAVHCDAVQAFCKHPLALAGDIDTAAVSAHKLHGPKGIGALYVRKGFNLDAVVQGGGQEQGLRSGTENVAYGAGFAKAVTEMPDAPSALIKIGQLNTALRQSLQQLPDIVCHSPADASPYILNFSLAGYKSETVLHFLERQGIYVSSGSACGRGARSHTLMAMGLPERLVDSALRVSFCADNSMADVEALVATLADAQQNLVRSGS